ncbi:DUF881 domain-containing protein [Salinispora mooreana]|uniref:DUF881 domain-containing protein n=1 Tax=Salinispora mooreana TaxID=999545 RepID=UPI00037B3CC0|nr:DUF881 domain-containing protein [Salinispora mooreana]
MSGDEHTETGTGWPDQPDPLPAKGTAGEPDPDELSRLVPEVDPEPAAADESRLDRAAGRPFSSALALVGGWRRTSPATVMIFVLLALLGFTLVEQLRTTSTDPTISAARQEDLVRILYDLNAREDRLRQDIAALEDSQRQLRSGEQGRQAALEEAARRADELGILAGTLPAQGPGLVVRFESGGAGAISAMRVLDAVQELRGAGAEAMQISGADGVTVRVIASTYFLDGEEGSLFVDGRLLTGPYTITVIGDPATMRTALNIPGGVVATVDGDGGTVIVEDREVTEVSALHAPIELEHARPIT